MTGWWRFDGWPTAGEWQAVWAFAAAMLAALLLYIAWKQLHGLSESNKRLAESNTLLAESNRALSRPTIVVEFAFERVAWRNYTSSSNESTVFVVVQNVGASPAIDVNLHVSPMFEATEKKLTVLGLEALNELFAGRTPIRMIAPGQKLKYVLDSAKDAMRDVNLPAEYTVVATYTDIERAGSYAEQFVLQMSPWGMSVAEVDSVKQISKDIQFISENLRSAQRGLPAITSAMRLWKQSTGSKPQPVRHRPRLRGVIRRRA